MGTTIWMPALVGVQALHGLTFALLHMVAMRIIAISIPERLAATAQSFYGAFALGVASAALTLASGYLYGLLGIRAFWAMAGLCALALPLVGGLSPPSSNPKASQVRV
jgi:PPP family 3-phenylpropionic acid transporter